MTPCACPVCPGVWHCQCRLECDTSHNGCPQQTPDKLSIELPELCGTHLFSANLIHNDDIRVVILHCLHQHTSLLFPVRYHHAASFANARVTLLSITCMDIRELAQAVGSTASSKLSVQPCLDVDGGMCMCLVQKFKPTSRCNLPQPDRLLLTLTWPHWPQQPVMLAKRFTCNLIACVHDDDHESQAPLIRWEAHQTSNVTQKSGFANTWGQPECKVHRQQLSAQQTC